METLRESLSASECIQESYSHGPSDKIQSARPISYQESAVQTVENQLQELKSERPEYVRLKQLRVSS